MFNGKLYTIILAIVLPAAVLAQTDYCSKTLCSSGKPHIACNNKGAFQSACSSNAKIVPISDEMKKLILNKHNTLRNQVAKGFGKFSPAVRMATMRWSPELAKLAELNVKQCVMKHDKCRNTNKFKFAGQNLAVSSWKGVKKTVNNIIDRHIQIWFDEYKDCSMSYINKYASTTNGKAIGHFTAMMQEKSTHVGCAVLRQVKSNGFTEQFLACNYAFTNVMGKPVYRTGKAASKCTTGVNKKYKFLCSIKEKYNVNVA